MSCEKIYRLLFGLSLLGSANLLCSGRAQAQGYLPVMAGTSTVVQPQEGPVMVSRPVPEDLKVVDSSGTVRTLLSYKSYIEVLVVAFLSDRCPGNHDQWAEIRRTYDQFKDWRVSFVGIQADPSENTADLRRAMDQAKVPFPLLQDPNQAVAKKFAVKGIPTWLIIDEGAALRYRGPLIGPNNKRYVRQALDAVISHTEPVHDPEPGDPPACPLP